MDEKREHLITLNELLEIVGVSRSTFEKWRSKSMAPRTYKLPSGGLRFKLSDVEDWLEGLAIDDPETIRLEEIRERYAQGKKIPLRLYGPPVRGHR